MEGEFAGLSLEEEEDEIFQIQSDVETNGEVEVLQLVGRFLTASIVHFPAMRNTMANVWHPVKGVQIRDLGEKSFVSENLAIQMGNFIGEFMEYDGSNMGKEGRNFMRIR
ncbi:hypothetical protein Gotur_016743, partial [Gossypium turneri]